MKKLLGLVLLLSSCISQIPTGDAYTKAQRIPRVYPVVSVEVRDDFVLMAQDIDFDGHADVILVHKNMNGKPSIRPSEYIWVTRNKEGKYDVYARQTDTDMDGKFEYVSGNVKKMNKWIDKLE